MGICRQQDGINADLAEIDLVDAQKIRLMPGLVGGN